MKSNNKYTKAQLVARLDKLLEEREVVRKKYQNDIKRMTSKVRKLRYAISSREQKETRLRMIYKAACEFFDVKTIRTTKTSNRTSQKTTLMRWVFCKYALESSPLGIHIDGAMVSLFLKKKYIKYSLKARERLTASFKDNPENKETWMKFKLYVSQFEKKK
jgi:hypothetical protein